LLRGHFFFFLLSWNISWRKQQVKKKKLVLSFLSLSLISIFLALIFRAKKCIPDFVNAAFGRDVEVSHSCGVKEATRMCFLSDGTGVGFPHYPPPTHEDDPTENPSTNGGEDRKENSFFSSSSSSEILVDATSPKNGISFAKKGEEEDGNSSELDFGEMESKFFDEDDYIEEDDIDGGGDADTDEHAVDDDPTVEEPSTSTSTTTTTTTTTTPRPPKRQGGGRRRNGKNKQGPKVNSRVTRGLFLRNGKINRQHQMDSPQSTCHVCDASDSKLSRPPTFMTDLNNPNNLTCWETNPFVENAERENVTLTLSLGKKFELTYVSLSFCGQKPDSMAIYKSMDFGRSWQPFQYYSSHCKKTYGRQNRSLPTTIE
jgi:hypothetical protein